MDKQAFKQRMQNLKSYRENNPGKGYWDWRAQAFIDGGTSEYTDNRTDHPIQQKDFIINYLIDCLVENQPFDCSSLGPNKYLNE